jgi:hypothetical protein
MKRRKHHEQTIARYLAAFIEIKAAIDANPKVHTSPIVRQFKIGTQPIGMLKKLGVIEYKKGGHKRWVGNAPNVEMVIQITEAIHNYHAELKSRKRNGEMFLKTKKQPQIKPIVVQKELHHEWQRSIEKQNAEKTNIPIQEQPFDQSMISEFIEHDEKPKVKHGELTSSKPKPRTFEVKIFGIRLFTINY